MSTGTLVLPDPDDVREGVQYGADGTEFTGTLQHVPYTSGGSYMLARLRDIVNELRDKGIGIHRVTYFSRTAGDTFAETGVEFWALRQGVRKGQEDGISVVRARWSLLRTDDPLQAVEPAPAGKVTDEVGVTWFISPMEGEVEQAYYDPDQDKNLIFRFDAVATVS